MSLGQRMLFGSNLGRIEKKTKMEINGENIFYLVVYMLNILQKALKSYIPLVCTIDLLCTILQPHDYNPMGYCSDPLPDAPSSFSRDHLTLTRLSFNKNTKYKNIRLLAPIDDQHYFFKWSLINSAAPVY